MEYVKTCKLKEETAAQLKQARAIILNKDNNAKATDDEIISAVLEFYISKNKKE